MTPEEFQMSYPLIIDWINQLLMKYKSQMKTVASTGFEGLRRCFKPELLGATKFVLIDRIPLPPLSSMGLSQFAEFEKGDYIGITYLDTFFVSRDKRLEENLYCHELIHILQWKYLGPENFLAVYAKGLEAQGYLDSPLEKMAYLAQELFASGKIFDAEKFVQDKMDFASSMASSSDKV